METRKIRVVLAKPGLDGHDRGAKILASAFRDAGMEVIYLGLRQTPEMIINAALQEDADVIGLSIHSGAHMTILPAVLDLKKKNGMDDVLFIAGGIIPEKDMKALLEMGVDKLFGPGIPTTEAVNFIKNWFNRKNRD